MGLIGLLIKFLKWEIKLNIVLLTKGLSIEAGKLITISYKIKNELKKNGFDDVIVSTIKGPCLAAGLANKMRTGTVILVKTKIQPN